MEKVQEVKNLKPYTGNDKLVTLNAGISALHLAYHIAMHQNDYKGYRNSNEDYNEIRPYSSLNYKAPKEFLSFISTC